MKQSKREERSKSSTVQSITKLLKEERIIRKLPYLKIHVEVDVGCLKLYSTKIKLSKVLWNIKGENKENPNKSSYNKSKVYKPSKVLYKDNNQGLNKCDTSFSYETYWT